MSNKTIGKSTTQFLVSWHLSSELVSHIEMHLPEFELLIANRKQKLVTASFTPHVHTEYIVNKYLLLNIFQCFFRTYHDISPQSGDPDVISFIVSVYVCERVRHLRICLSMRDKATTACCQTCAQMLREAFDVAMDTCRCKASVPFFSMMCWWWCPWTLQWPRHSWLGHRLVFSHLHLRSELRCRGLLKMEGPFPVRRGGRSRLLQT